MKILFICKGNVARIQMAEALFRKISDNQIEVFSAGTQISGQEQPLEELMPKIKEVLDVMKEEEIDISKYVRKQLTNEMINDADKIIVIMEEHEPLPDYLADSPKFIKWSVPDPKGKDLEFTRKVKNQIKAKVEGLIQEL